MLSIERSAVMSAIFLYPSVRDSPNLAPDFCFTITLSGVSFSMVMIEMQNFVCFNDFFFCCERPAVSKTTWKNIINDGRSFFPRQYVRDRARPLSRASLLK